MVDSDRRPKVSRAVGVLTSACPGGSLKDKADSTERHVTFVTSSRIAEMCLIRLTAAVDSHHMNLTSPRLTTSLRRVTRIILVAGAAVCLSLPLVSSGNAGAASTCGVSSELVPTCGVLWGAHSSSGYASMESQIGRQLAIVHDYTDWPATFPSVSEEAAAASGRILFVDWTARDYATDEAAATWAQIADGTQDAHINAEAAVLKAFGQPIMVTFHAEPEQSDYASYGTAADYVAAWQHIHNVFAADGVANVVWVWDVMGDPSGHNYTTWYPGDAFVDWIMWDPYNWYGCNTGSTTAPWKTFSQIVTAMYQWLTTNSGTPGNGNYLSKPWGLAEYGTVEGASPTDKQHWYESSVTEARTSFPNLKALVYFNSDDVTHDRQCNWTVGTSADSLAGFQAAGAEPYFATMNVPPPATTTTPPPPPPSGMPTIVQNPVSMSAAVGARVSFRARASGTPSPTVVWQSSTNGGASWVTLKEHTDTSYTVVSVVAAYNGLMLRARFTNSVGLVTSAVAVLTVTLPPARVLQLT